MAFVFLDTLGNPNGVPITVGRRRLQRLAKHWHYVIRSRGRWISDNELRQIIEARAASHLNAIGVSTGSLQQIAACGVVQVRMEYSDHQESPPQTSPSDGGWESRLIPWEYLLTAATAKYRNGPLVVVRQLKIASQPARCQPGGDSQALFIESAPGRLRGLYEFEIEQQVLKSHLGKSATWLPPLVNPSLQAIADRTGALRPHIVHVSGFDTFQGTRLLDPEQNTTAVTSINDGMFLRNESWDETPVDALPLASALAAGAIKPAMVSFNLFNSSARTAAFAVARGAGAALGFQDYIDDRVAEIFFANFYWQWRKQRWNTLAAFAKAMETLTPYKEKLRGTGIVLWSAESLVAQPLPAADSSPSTSEPGERPAQRFRTEVLPRNKLNYSVLQNSKRPLFDRFSVYKFLPEPVHDLTIEAELQVGLERFPYRRTFEMQHHVLDLSEEIGVGLTSQLVRSLRESVRTTLFVRVAAPDAAILTTTYHISLLPIDEWKDDGENRTWLPSFVLPRDPAVLEVVMRAQRYLMALRDDAAAGFDGYQPLEAESPDLDAVDSQVRAIWYALLHDYTLSYINPPPAFTLSSQRLRTPSDILRGQRGTCIDLALLIASCLEFMDIKPVIFLLNGHAFAGYWSSEERREEFLVGPNPAPLMEADNDPTPLPGEAEVQEATETYLQRVAWEFDKSRYEEVRDAITKGDLVPIETTLLTNRGGFWEAVDVGTENLADPAEFQAMLDVRLARDHDVTPLPLESDRR